MQSGPPSSHGLLGMQKGALTRRYRVDSGGGGGGEVQETRVTAQGAQQAAQRRELFFEHNQLHCRHPGGGIAAHAIPDCSTGSRRSRGMDVVRRILPQVSRCFWHID
jgi:hypothetical protein